ncbi:MAG TPA: dihydropteroate synthase [Acidimicrobiia bacterium]|nr:dihydropteroate synthase [Acidimicrobiia bacterium]
MAEPPVWRLANRRLALGRPLVMGVVNVTPDSFSDGGLFDDPVTAIAHGRQLAEEGADIVDVGGESARPGSEPIDARTEKRRVLPVVRQLAAEGIVVSIDTTKAEVAAAAVAAGAEIINDVAAGADPDMLEVMAQTGSGIVLMHMLGTPRTMQDDPRYDDVVQEVRDFLVARAEQAEGAGVHRSAIVIDPGIGFGKTALHNLELLRRLGDLVATGRPVLVGASRKAFLGLITGRDQPRDRDVATAAVTALAVAAGAAAVRVHDVRMSRDAADVAWALARGRI